MLTPVRVMILASHGNQGHYSALFAGIDVFLAAMARVCNQGCGRPECARLLLQHVEHRLDLFFSLGASVRLVATTSMVWASTVDCAF
jgi:hypothetical protein